MDDVPPPPRKGSLSIDRAAFLLLRVKKAFKKKRQQRKEKGSLQNANDVTGGTKSSSGPKSNERRYRLSRSLTLPSITATGNIKTKRSKPEDNFKTSSNNFLYESKFGPITPVVSPKIFLTTDDSSFDYRRKSSGGSSGLYSPNIATGSCDPYIYDFDEKKQTDGSVLISITSPTKNQTSAAQSLLNYQNFNYYTANFNYNANVNTSNNSKSPLISNSTNSAIYKLARIINQTTKTTINSNLANVDTGGMVLSADDTTRRLSWERRDKSCNPIPRSASIDSMVDAVWSELPSTASSRRDTQMSNASQFITPSFMTPSNRRESMLSPCTNRRSKQHRGISALFAAVEHGHLEKARTILESTDVDVNSLNSDGLSPLDVAVLSNNRSMTKMLLQQGAMETAHIHITNTIGSHLNNLLCEAENTIHELGNFDNNAQMGMKTTFSNIIGSGPSVTSCTGSEIDKQVGLWERRVKGLRRMILGWDQTKPPDLPSRVDIDVTGCASVSVRIHEPIEGAITTKFKIQWSSRADFSNVVGERDISEWTSFHGSMGALITLRELTQGRRYFFRACCGNIKGWGPPKTSYPNCIVPSSWRDVESKENRFVGKQRNLDELFNAVRLARPEDAADIALDSSGQQKRISKKKTTIKQLFSAASKFQKNLKRGIYLACILYHEDKLLLTNEDFVPVIEIDETFTSSLHTDFYWLMKVACTWDDVKLLRMDMERNASSAIHFRTKILSAACQMQSALSITDLGQLYYKPLRDAHGTVVLCCVNAIKNPKSISVLNARWIPLNKIHKKFNLSSEDSSINEILMNSIQEQINYHQVSNIRLTKGLYVGYLKMHSSVDLIQVVVPAKTPNVLPHCKIRDNSHVSAEEWELIKQNKQSNSLEFRPKSTSPSEVQMHFLEMLTKAVQSLFQYMDVSMDNALLHRLYDIEVIELNNEVSFLIICPPAESTCAVPGQRDHLQQRGDLLSMPIQAFEMIHLKTYQSNIIQKYSRLSCILELDTMLANHLHREAFSSSELQKAKDRLSKIQDLSTSLNGIWKGVRWLMDVITYARDRANMPELNMRQILDNKFAAPMNAISNEATIENQFLQAPNSNYISGTGSRGSWPGPALESSLAQNGLLEIEHSKSEQLLQYNSQNFLSTSPLDQDDLVHSRKNSGDSTSTTSCYSMTNAENTDQEFAIPRLPPSRSENTLVVERKKLPNSNVVGSSKKRHPVLYPNNTSTSSPLLSVQTMTQASTTDLPDGVEAENSENKNSNIMPLKVLHVSKKKLNVNFDAEGKPVVTYLQPTLAALQNEAKLCDQSTTLHISESSGSGSSSSDLMKPFLDAPDLKIKQEVRSDLADRHIQPIQRRAHSAHQIKGPSEKIRSSKTNNVQQGDQKVENLDQQSSTSTSSSTSILQVYAAYETGLASGTSLKLRVTQKTSAREVIDLVVKQLNMAVVLKGKDGPIYTSDKLDNFCLVAVIGARERCLRDDFRPLQLQNPWKKGRLYVRQKHDVLAAIEHSNRDASVI